MKIEIEGDLSHEEFEALYEMYTKVYNSELSIDKIFKRSYLSDDGLKFEYGVSIKPIVLGGNNHEN